MGIARSVMQSIVLLLMIRRHADLGNHGYHRNLRRPGFVLRLLNRRAANWIARCSASNWRSSTEFLTELAIQNSEEVTTSRLRQSESEAADETGQDASKTCLEKHSVCNRL